MKKIKYHILLLLFLIPTFVSADMSSPYSHYKARVSNPEGTMVYYYGSIEGRIAYDTEVIVTQERIVDNELYAQIRLEDDSRYGQVLISDIMPLKVDLNDYKQDSIKKYYVFDENCYLYKGPSKIYGLVEPQITLEVGMAFESSYYDEMWTYVSYNGVSGWVYTYPYISLSPYKELTGISSADEPAHKTMYALRDLMLYKSPLKKEKLGEIIPAGTSFDIRYVYSKDRVQFYYYVSYNGINGWVNGIVEDECDYDKGWTIAVAYEDEGKVIIKNKDGVILHQRPFFDESVSDVIVPYNTILKYGVSYSYDWVYVSYEGNFGWIRVLGSENDVEYYNNGSETNDEQENEKQDGEKVNNSHSNAAFTKVDKKNISINDVILYSVIISLVLCFGGIVAIKTTNKKKEIDVKKSKEKNSENIVVDKKKKDI